MVRDSSVLGSQVLKQIGLFSRCRGKPRWLFGWLLALLLLPGQASLVPGTIAHVLLPPIGYTVLFYGGFVVGVIGLICVAIGGVAIKQTGRAPLPEAVIANKRPRKGVLWQLLGGFALIGGPAASIWLWFHHNEILFVRTGASSPTTVRRVWIGSGYSPKHSLDDHPRRRSTWIVNESSRDVIAQSFGYGDSLTTEPITIPPGASLPVESVDHIGPEDQPPSVVTVTRPREVAKAGISASARRVWLTW